MHNSKEPWQALELWAEGNEDLLSAIKERANLKKVSSGNTLLASGDKSSDVLFILSGSFSIIRYAASGYEVRLNTIKKGEWIGEMAALNARERNAFVVAAEDSQVAALPQQSFLKLMQEYGEFSLKIAGQISDRLDETSQRMFDLAAKTSSDRIYSEIIRLSRVKADSGDRYIAPSPSVTELAARLSMARETASRTINRLERKHLLVREPNCWRIIGAHASSDKPC